MGVRVPPFAPAWNVFAFALLLATLGASCRDSARARAERHLDQRLELLDGVIDILDEHKGDQDTAVAALRRYVAEHRIEVRELRVLDKEIEEALSPEARDELEEEARKAQMARETRIRNLARTFDEPDEILRLVRLAQQ